MEQTKRDEALSIISHELRNELSVLTTWAALLRRAEGGPDRRRLAAAAIDRSTEIARRLRISQPLLSWHLHRLKRSGIVRAVRVGREVRCSFDRERFSSLNERGFRTLVNPSAVSQLDRPAVEHLDRPVGAK